MSNVHAKSINKCFIAQCHSTMVVSAVHTTHTCPNYYTIHYSQYQQLLVKSITELCCVIHKKEYVTKLLFQWTDQNKINVEEEFTNFESNMQHPKIISNQKCTDKVTSTQGLLNQENLNQSDSGFEGSDQNEKDFQYIDAQTLIRGIENSNQINHQIVMVSNPIYNL